MKNYIAKDSANKLRGVQNQLNSEIAKLKKLSTRIYDILKDIEIAVQEEETDDDLEEFDLVAEANEDGREV